jgi:hypothetical protein
MPRKARNSEIPQNREFLVLRLRAKPEIDVKEKSQCRIVRLTTWW